MVILYQERCTGKTCTLISLSARNNVPIATAYNTRYIKNTAKEMGLEIPEPIHINSLDDLRGVEKVYIDEIEGLFQKIIPCKVEAITMSPDERLIDLF